MGNFRSNVRDKAREKNTGAILGVRLEDKTTGSVWKLMDPKEILAQMEEKKRKEEEKKQAAAAAKALKEKKDAMNRLSPEEFMRQLTIDDADKGEILKYSKFDDATGLPTHFHDGEPLNKNQTKKAGKEFQGQKKKYEKYLSKQN